MYIGKFRHIYRRHNIIWQPLSTKVIYIDYVRSNDNITNLLTNNYIELVEKSSKWMELMPLTKWANIKEIHPNSGDPKIRVQMDKLIVKNII